MAEATSTDTRQDGAHAALPAQPRVPALRPHTPPPPPKRRLWLWGGALLLGAALAAAAASPLWLARPTPVAVEIAALAPVTRVLAVNGRVAALHAIDVRSVFSGTLSELPVSEGARVAQDQILAQVDAAAQTAAVRQAVAALDASIVAEQQASETYERTLALGNIVSRTTLEDAAHALQSARQDVARLTAALDQAQILLATYTIRAPVAGTVLDLDAEAGQVVGPSTRLLTLADLSELVVEADVDEAYATQIALDQRAVLQLAGETETREGHVSFVSNRVDESTGGLAIKIAFDTPVAAPVGLTVATNIIVEQRAAALTVPRAALVDTDAVYVVRDGVAVRRALGVVDWPAPRLIVTEGLSAGDIVITDATGIAPGDAVSVDQP